MAFPARPLITNYVGYCTLCEDDVQAVKGTFMYTDANGTTVSTRIWARYCQKHLAEYQLARVGLHD